MSAKNHSKAVRDQPNPLAGEKAVGDRTSACPREGLSGQRQVALEFLDRLAQSAVQQGNECRAVLVERGAIRPFSRDRGLAAKQEDIVGRERRARSIHPFSGLS